MTGSTVFGAESLSEGAFLPIEARSRLESGLLLPDGVLSAAKDTWLTSDIPVLVRDLVRIIPVAWWGDPGRGYNAYADPADITRYARRLLDAGMQAAGPWSAIDLSDDAPTSLGSYVAALRASGATKADRFVYTQDGLGVVVVWAGAEDAGDRSLAVHVVPQSWVFEPAAEWPVGTIDLAWSWADVVELCRRDHVEDAG